MTKSPRKLRLVPSPSEFAPPAGEDRDEMAAPEAFILLSAFVVSFSGVAYELLLATYATYLWGGTVFQYSLVFSSMMLAMGLGSWVADHPKVAAKLNGATAFLLIESLLSVAGVVALPVLYYVYWRGFYPVGFVFAFSLGLGFLVGLEIPFLNRWLRREKKIAELLAVDFAGGFLGGILFPLFLAPQLGLFRVAGVVAFLNACVAAVGWYKAKDTVSSLAVPLCAAVSVCLAGCFLYWATLIQSWLQNRFFGF